MIVYHKLPMPRCSFGLELGTYCGDAGLRNWQFEWDRSWRKIQDRIAYDFAVELAAIHLSLT